MLDQHMYNEKTSSSLAKSRLAMNKLLTDSQEQNGSQDIYKRQQWKPEGETERWEWLKEQMTWADVFLLRPLFCLWTYLDTLFLRLTGPAMFCLHKGQNRFLLNSFVLREETVLSRSEFCHWIFFRFTHLHSIHIPWNVSMSAEMLLFTFHWCGIHFPKTLRKQF